MAMTSPINPLRSRSPYKAYELEGCDHEVPLAAEDPLMTALTSPDLRHLGHR